MAITQIRVEVHPVAAQSCQPIAMPEEARQSIQLMSRVEPIEQAVFDVARASFDDAIANS